MVLLLVNSHASFVSSFNLEAHKLFGVNNAYDATNHAAAKAGYTTPPFGFGPLGPTMLLVPAMMFFILWPNWGATLYGEIRGASDFRRVFTGMFIGLWITVILTVIFFLLIAKTVGWGFYQNLNSLDYNLTPQFGIWPYPFLFAGWLVHNTAFQVILLLALSLWFFGWVGTLFLSSTRVIFAAAFDRVLPDRAAEVSEKRKVPVWSLILMLGPAVVLAAVYAYSTTFRTYTLDATLVIAVTYLFSAVAVVILPLHQERPVAGLSGQPDQDLRRADRAGGRPDHDRPAGVQPVEWLWNDNYFVNNHDSLIYMGAMYVLAIVIYVVARLVRRRQGIDLGLINKEIPVE